MNGKISNGFGIILILVIALLALIFVNQTVLKKVQYDNLKKIEKY